MESFEKTLDLGDLGVPYALTKDLDKTSGVSSSIPTVPVFSQRAEINDDDLAQLKMMRTESSDILEGKPPEQKWSYLFGMYKKWKTNNDIEEASIVGVSTAEQREQEVKKLRQAIKLLQNKKTITSSDAKLLKKLQGKLKALSYK